jgi:hypothetical protein
MNHSLLSADCTTHLKIIVVALVAGLVVVVAGISGRVNNAATLTARTATAPVVVKAGKPAMYSIRETGVID